MVRRMDLESLFGLMDQLMLENGRMANSMGWGKWLMIALNYMPYIKMVIL